MAKFSKAKVDDNKNDHQNKSTVLKESILDNCVDGSEFFWVLTQQIETNLWKHEENDENEKMKMIKLFMIKLIRWYQAEAL